MKKSLSCLLFIGAVFALTGCAPSAELSAPSTPVSSAPTECTAYLPADEDVPVAEPQPALLPYAVITASSLNVRKSPSASAFVVGALDRDVHVSVIGSENGFLRTYYRGSVAYVSEKYAERYTVSPADDRTEAVIAQGTKCIGTPYVYGAVRLHDGKGNFYRNFTDQRFDCSSLMQYIFYYGAGVYLNETTRTQIYQGQRVEKSNLSRGDVIYFTNASRVNNTGIERVGHVALYLGNNRILHTASDYCKIEEMTSLRWQYYIEARRML